MNLITILQSGTLPPGLLQVLEAHFGYYSTAVNAYDLINYIVYLQQRIIALEAAAVITPPAPPVSIAS